MHASFVRARGTALTIAMNLTLEAVQQHPYKHIIRLLVPP